MTSRIFTTLSIALALSGAFAFFSTPAKAEAACQITNAEWYSNLTGSVMGLRSAATPGLELVVTTNAECGGKTGHLILDEVDATYDNNVRSSTFPVGQSGTVRIPLNAGEKYCEPGTGGCVIEADVYISLGGGVSTQVYDVPYDLTYSCKNTATCDQSVLWTAGSTSGLGDLSQKTKVTATTAQTSCKVTDARFNPGLGSETQYPHGLDNPNNNMVFFRDANRPVMTFEVTTQNCANQDVYLSLMETSGMAGSLGVASADGVPELSKYRLNVPANNRVTMTTQAGETSCMQNANDPDCRYYLYVSPDLTLSNPNAYYSKGKEKGFIAYDCDGLCNKDWTIGSTTAQNQDTNLNSVTVEGTSLVDPNSSCADAATGTVTEGCYEIYDGLAEALGNKVTSIKTDSLGSFLNSVIALVIGVAGVLTVGMIMYNGYRYAFERKEGDVVKMSVARTRIFQSVLGFLLLLSTYTLLRTINPDLLNLTPRFESAALSAGAELTPAQFQEITGEPLGTPSQYDALAKQVATQYGSDYCALRVIIKNETNGNAALIGQDENAPVNIPSRRAFVNSGRKYSGASFTSNQSMVTNRKFCNDATQSCIGTAPNPNSETLGLDWRFSKGIGLTQITFFPEGYSSNYTANWSNRTVAPSRTFNFPDGAMTVKPKEVFAPEKNLEISAKLWKAGMAQCNNNPRGAFYTYACGSCSCTGTFAQTEVAERTSQYNQCKSENP